MPLPKIAVPSPSVLSFLRTQVRYAFDSPRAQCAAIKEQRCAYGTAGRAVRGSRPGTRDGRVAATNLRLEGSGSCLLERTTLQSSRMARLDLALSRTSLVASNASIHQTTNTYSNNRAFTTTSLSKAWELFGGKGRQSARLQAPPTHKDPIDTPVGFDSLGRMTRAANELKMRCTELDEQGNVTMVSGEFKKSELIARVRDIQSRWNDGKY